MIRINSIEYQGRAVPLISGEALDSTNNTFTVLVGKNGLGKSRLLASLAKEYTNSFASYEEGVWGLTSYSHRDPVVIAISTSPFDKFPAASKKRGRISNYRYVGMRGEGLYSASSSIQLLSSVTRGLLGKLLYESNRADLVGVFGSLSFSSTLEFILKPMFSSTRSDYSKSIRIRALEGRDDFYIDARFESIFRGLSSEDRSTLEYAIDNVGYLLQEKKAFRVLVDFAPGVASIEGKRVLPPEIKSIIMLMDLGLIRLMDIRAEKFGYGTFSLRAASSGEQCLIVLMLGIASYIENGSLILIDEPEISLHPEWQENFVDLLREAFSLYDCCQFIIATHSPQITARMRGENSFVVSLGKNELIPSAEFANRSADYQLAEIFDSPGFKNEYISRLSFGLVAKIRSGMTAQEETSRELENLLRLRAKLDSDDPTVRLIDSVKELFNKYA